MEIIFNIFVYGVGGLIVLYFFWLALNYFGEWLEDKTNMQFLLGFVLIGLLAIFSLSLYVWLVF